MSGAERLFCFCVTLASWEERGDALRVRDVVGHSDRHEQLGLDGRQVPGADGALGHVVGPDEREAAASGRVDDGQLGAGQHRAAGVGGVAGDGDDQAVDRLAERVDQVLRVVAVVDDGHDGRGGDVGRGERVVGSERGVGGYERGQAGVEQPGHVVAGPQADGHAGGLRVGGREHAAVDYAGLLGDGERAAVLRGVVHGDLDGGVAVLGDDDGLVGVEDHGGEEAERLDGALVGDDDDAVVGVILQGVVDLGGHVVELGNVERLRGVEQHAHLDVGGVGLQQRHVAAGDEHLELGADAAAGAAGRGVGVVAGVPGYGRAVGSVERLALEKRGRKGGRTGGQNRTDNGELHLWASTSTLHTTTAAPGPLLYSPPPSDLPLRPTDTTLTL